MNYKNYLKKEKKRSILIKIIRISIIIIFLTLWEYFSYKGIINSFIYSSPSKIISTIISLYKQNNLFLHIFTTLKEVLIAFSIGTLLGFIIALLFYENNFIYKIFEPFLTLLNSMPKVALGPIIIIIAGANQKSIIIMAILINLIVNITTIYNGFSNTDYLKIKLLDTFYASKWQKIIHLIIPSSLSTIITSLKLNISLTLIGVITGEFLVSKQGIGYLIIYGSQVFNLTLVITGIFLLLIISYLLYLIINLIEKNYFKKK